MTRDITPLYPDVLLTRRGHYLTFAMGPEVLRLPSLTGNMFLNLGT